MSLSLGDAGVTSARNTFSTAKVAAPDRRSEPAFTRQLWMMGLFLKQCAAVRTQPGPMMLPPQMCSFLYCRLTCQGHASMAAGLPPSTRGVLTLCPQLEQKRDTTNPERHFLPGSSTWRLLLLSTTSRGGRGCPAPASTPWKVGVLL